MPPQTQEIEFLWKAKKEEIEIKKARQMQKLSDRAFLHQWTELSSRGKRLRWPDPESGRWFSVSAYTGFEPRLEGRWSYDSLEASERKSVRMAGLRFKIENATRLALMDPRRRGQNVWAMDLKGARSFDWKSDGKHFFAASNFEEKVFYFFNPRSFRKVQRWKWDEQSDLIALLMCPTREQVVVENHPETGLTRLVGFYELKPKWFTVFDFSQGKRQSVVTKVMSENCRDFYVTSTHGLYRVSY